MKKNILLTILLVFLMLMNGVLLYIVLNKPEKRNRPPRDFITKQLQLNENQLVKFHEFDSQHHRKMRKIDSQSNDLKQYLFNNIGRADFSENKLDSVTNSLGKLSADREKEVFSYFKKIEKICDSDQKLRLNRIVERALKGGPRKGGPLPPRK